MQNAPILVVMENGEEAAGLASPHAENSNAEKVGAGPSAGAAAPPPGTTTEETAQAPEPSPANAVQGEAFDLGRAVSYRETVAKGDGFLELTVTEDGMKATADLYPPAEGGAPLAIEQAQKLCARLGIVRGQDWEGLSQATMTCNLDHAVLRDVVVAEGLTAEPVVIEHSLAVERFRSRPQPPPDDALRYDFHERPALTIVRKGELLANHVPSSVGCTGYDIRGRELPSPRVSAKGVVAGKNTESQENGIVAMVDGILAPLDAEGNGTLAVEEVLLIHGDVDYHTGHIVFPGDVVIDGAVSDGFKVYSGATIHCRATIDAFDVNAKQDLICDQGIIGRKKAQVRVGGELHAKFIQNCRVAVRGNVQVQTGIIASRVYSLGRIDLGDKGVIMGGEVYAIHGIKAHRLGNQAHQSTFIHAGTDFTVQQRLDQANEKLRILAIGALHAKAESAGRQGPALDHFLARTKEAEDKLHFLIGELLGSLDADEDAVVEVTGEIFPGTVVEICRVTIEVDELLPGCRFRLDKAAGRILVERGKAGGKGAGQKPPAQGARSPAQGARSPAGPEKPPQPPGQ